jgi:hypothetical protein
MECRDQTSALLCSSARAPGSLALPVLAHRLNDLNLPQAGYGMQVQGSLPI